MKSLFRLNLLIVLCLNCIVWGAEAPIVYPKPIKPTPIKAAKQGHVIMLLGSTSVGKTFIRYKLTEFLEVIKRLPEIVQIVMDGAEDRGVPAAIMKQFPTDWSTEQILLFQDTVKAAQDGKLVICDSVLFSNDCDITESFINKLKEYTDTTSILVYCSMERLLTNITSRNDSGNEGERRDPLNAVEKYLDMYLSPTPDSEEYKRADYVSSPELENGIRVVKTLPIDSDKEMQRERCVRRMQVLRDSPASPIMFNSKLYDYTIKNDEGCDLENQLAPICYKLVKLLT